MTLTFRPVNRDNFYQVICLDVRADQKTFVASNAVSIAETTIHPDWEALAIYADETLVGFTMWGKDDQYPVEEWWIIRLMIDQAQQGKGYGRAAMEALIPRIQARTGGKAIFLSFEPENAVAEALYRSLGFQPTGRVEGGEIVYRLAAVGE